MRRLGKLGEIIPAQRIPFAVAVGPAQVLRHGGEHAQVGWRGAQQRRVVLHRGGYKDVVVRVFARLGVVRVGDEVAVDEEALHPAVAHASGVAGDVHALGEVVHSAQQAAQELEAAPGELRRLVEEDPVVLLAVVLQLRGLAGPVAEMDEAAVGEIDGAQGAVVAAKLGVYHLEHGLYVVRLQLRVGAPENEDADAGVVVGAEQGLGAHGPGLAAALRAPVGRVKTAGGEEQLLLGVGLAGVPDIFSRHSAAPLPTPSSLMTSLFSEPAPPCRHTRRFSPA